MGNAMLQQRAGSALQAGAVTGGAPMPANALLAGRESAPVSVPAMASAPALTSPGASAQALSPDAIEQAHAHSEAIQSALHALTGQKGKLTTGSIAKAAADMLSNPNLPPGSGEELAKQAASLIAAIPPDADDAEIRLMLGRLMLHTAGYHDGLKARFPRQRKAA